ncbi:hypothetical protein [Streptomyces sp. NPDC048584]|uniref:hypothetical protein n=1 Tax=Streptomyces sp. NPDC048584 TaxID=3365573 RepID=UPI00371D022B
MRVLDTPERRRYAVAQAKLATAKELAKDREVRDSHHKSAVMLQHHRPENEENPDCDFCGTPWPCATAEYLMCTVGA